MKRSLFAVIPLVLFGYSTFAAAARPDMPIQENPAQENPAQGSPILARARQMFDAGEYAKAVEAYRTILEASPDDRDARLGLAESLLWNEQYGEAESAVLPLLDESPNDAAALWIQARALFFQADELRLSPVPSDLGIQTRYADAERIASKLLEADPKRDDVRVFRGNARFWLQNLEGAASDYEEALKHTPGDVSLLYTLGDLYSQYMGEPAKGVPYLERAVEAKPDFFEAHRGLGLAYIEAGDVEKGVGEAIEALRIRPNDPETFQALWDQFGKQQKYEEAVKLYDRILEEAPANYTAHWHKAFVFEQEKRYDDAIAECRAVLEANPDWLDVKNFMARVHSEAGQTADAVREWDAVLDQDPGNAEAHDGLLALARSKGEAGDYEGALGVFDELVRRFPNEAPLRADRALTLFNMNRVDEAVKAYEDAASVDPYDSQILNDMGLAYQGSQNFEKAIKSFLKAIELDGNIDAQENYAVLLFKLNDVLQAANRFERILFIDGSRERSLKYYLECRRILDLQAKKK